MTSEANWQEAVAATVSAFGKLDILVNNAGISGTFDPDTLSTSAWDRRMDVNPKGVFLGMKHAIPAMEQAGGGAIVNISSVSGFVGQNGIHMAYNASKGAVRLMTKSAAVQFARKGIRVNSVHPGVLPAMRTSKATADPVFREKMLAGVPMRRGARGGRRRLARRVRVPIRWSVSLAAVSMCSTVWGLGAAALISAPSSTCGRAGEGLASRPLSAPRGTAAGSAR